MTHRRRTALLRGALILIGVVMVAGVAPLMHWWPSGWRWAPYNPPYEHMIVAVYAVLGLSLLLAVRHPERHRSLILFAGWSSLAHGTVMAVDAARRAGERGHFGADVAALWLAAILLLALAPPAEARADA